MEELKELGKIERFGLYTYDKTDEYQRLLKEKEDLEQQLEQLEQPDLNIFNNMQWNQSNLKPFLNEQNLYTIHFSLYENSRINWIDSLKWAFDGSINTFLYLGILLLFSFICAAIAAYIKRTAKPRAENGETDNQ